MMLLALYCIADKEIGTCLKKSCSNFQDALNELKVDIKRHVENLTKGKVSKWPQKVMLHVSRSLSSA